MSIRILKKALGLLIVDIVIIIGIFVLQFRTDSNIIMKIGNLQITLESQDEQNGIIIYKNKLRVSYNGINFFCDDSNPALATKNGEKMAVRFISIEQKEPLSYTLNFDKDIKVTFELASEDNSASLAILTDLPDNVSEFTLPYNYSSNMTVQKTEKDILVLAGKRNAWELTAHVLSAERFGFTERNYVATYSIYDANQKFSFDSIIDLPIASAAEYAKNVSQFKRNLISSFEANNSEANITEQIAVSYVAAQAETGNFNRAIENVPDSVKKGRLRTYLSAPYFNTLEDMNSNLEKVMKDYENRISDSAIKQTSDLFTVHKIADFIYLHPGQNTVLKLLSNAATADVDSLSIAQITGILQVYADLIPLSNSYASVLEPMLEGCVERITAACKYEGSILTISENDTFLSVIQAVETGIALLRYGQISQNETLINAGYALVNSYLTESSSFDLRTLGNLYPVIAYDNTYYPHLEKISDIGENKVWAWTCAKSIALDKDSDEANFTVEFPEGDTHYIIVKGVSPFNSIYIYDMAFRTDPRFETYNSSGYVYKKSTSTLLLKSRHKSEFETIRLVYRQPSAAVVPAPAPKVEPAPAPVQLEVPKIEPAVTNETEPEAAVSEE